MINAGSVFYKAFRSFILLGLATFWVVRFEPAPCDIAFALAGVAWLVHRITCRTMNSLEITDWLLLGFLATGWVGLAYAPSLSKGIKFAGITTYLAVFYYLVKEASSDHSFRKRIILLYLGSALITTGLIWLTAMVSPFWQMPGISLLIHDSGRATALFKDPNVTGIFIVPVALYFLEKSLRNAKPAGVTALFLFPLCAVFLSASRGALLSLGLGCLMLFWLTPSTWRKRFSLVVFTVLSVELLSFTLAFYPAHIVSSMGRVFPHISLFRHVVTEGSPPEAKMLKSYPAGLVQHYDREGRIYAWWAGIEIFKSRPVLGTGPGSFESLSPAIEERLGATVSTPSAHNTYIRVLAENGISGFVLLLSFFIFAWRRDRYPDENLWIKAALAALLFNSFFIDSLHHRHLWLLLALL
ncbi:MAG: O-Antigen ligase [Firmicutes bacterium ADurb.Bin456]|nr:MAG: O-Antigen ligase [Firmicutes bacterium ADurb.Bin456]